ncbi:hypothetical protein [Corynebacterium halotolerans]|uniref:hypothetical protein n=1 Tax=Corynebacterium halotolerans TaxID=225326 RepID=UPI001FCBF043|nr:hypothetical protein [Corynebacterium halotolerans]
MSRRSLMKMSLAGVLGASLLLTAGCSGRTPVAGEADAASAEQIIVTDQRGQEVVIDGPIDTAAFAVIPAPSIFAAVDRSYDKVVGINQSTLVANRQGMFSTIFPESADSPTISGSDFVPNVETILNLDPDVVIQWGDMGEDVIQPIEDAGFPVVGLDYGTQEDLETGSRCSHSCSRSRSAARRSSPGSTSVATRSPNASPPPTGLPRVR